MESLPGSARPLLKAGQSFLRSQTAPRHNEEVSNHFSSFCKVRVVVGVAWLLLIFSGIYRVLPASLSIITPFSEQRVAVPPLPRLKQASLRAWKIGTPTTS